MTKCCKQIPEILVLNALTFLIKVPDDGFHEVVGRDDVAALGHPDHGERLRGSLSHEVPSINRSGRSSSFSLVFPFWSNFSLLSHRFKVE